ncbi:MAG: LemA family protein [Armatimonadota bacterium]
MAALWILLGIIALIIIWVIGAYNGLIVLKNRTNEAESDIDVQLKRRHNLVANLVETVKGYATHEKGVFEEVTKARTMAMQAGSMEDKAKAENFLTGTLKSLFAVSENYPDLKASTNFLELQRELTDIEDMIQASRRFYNANVRDFNTKQEVFPTNIIAGMLGFKKREFFDIDEAEKAVPKVAF